MANPLNTMNPQSMNIRGMANQFKNMLNPMNNPQVQQVMKLVGNRNPKDVFYQLCKERNIDPNEILSQLK